VLVRFEPTEQEIEEKLIELAYTWGDIEEEIELTTIQHDAPEFNFLSQMIGRAFRVEAQFGENGFGDPCTFYVLLYDVTEDSARNAARELESHPFDLARMIQDRARPWHTSDNLLIKQVPPSTPVEGQICRRLGEKHPARVTPSLEDIPVEIKPGAVELVERDVYKLTPIEAQFFDALRDTGLTFAVQPWIQGTDRKYRVDFLVFHDGRCIAVELDGHDYHKTKEQRSRDAERDRWLAARKIETLRWTGSQVFGDPRGCVTELRDVLRAVPSRA
jgi:very-short-patch-repair endonuclease